jgi:tetratricopeptide (TPR) repeat protein
LLDQLGGRTRPDPLETAQEIIYDAWDASDSRKRVALAKRALSLSPLCADAYVLLAQETARNPDEAVNYYRQGVAAGEKALGKACFRDDVGHFWGLLETRPYMRARQGLAQTLWDMGQRDEAVAHYQNMLRLNPNDNQGIRYLLLDCLLFLGRHDEAAKLISSYDRDGSAAWSWSRALLAFRRLGDCAEARDALLQARSANKHVASLLLGDKKMPRRLPDYISWGGKDEAVAYVHGAASAWGAAPGALAWLRAYA